jgi:transcriptional regulator with XRE-family HTH domain
MTACPSFRLTPSRNRPTWTRRDGSGGVLSEGRRRLVLERNRVGGARLAYMTGVTRQAIDYYCAGKRKPSPDQAQVIEAALGIAWPLWWEPAGAHAEAAE